MRRHPRQIAARLLRHDLDMWERHRIVARLAGDPGSVLDAGGIPGQLSTVLPGTRVVAANVAEPADVVYDGRRLPFPDRAFDVATSLDVLEHLPADERGRHLGEVVRVARRRAIVCCPLGTPEHVRAERELADRLAAGDGARDPFLDEHLAHGLPTEGELRGLVADVVAAAGVVDARARIAFHGDVRRANALFRAQVAAGRVGGPRERVAYALARLRARPDLSLTPVATAWTNRAFVVVSAGAASR